MQPRLGAGHARRPLACALTACLGMAALSGCTPQVTAAPASATEQVQAATWTAPTSSTATNLLDTTALFSSRDLDPTYDEAKATTIALEGSSATVTGDGATYADGVVTISQAGTYVLSGSLSEGRVVVDAAEDAKVQLVLKGASVTTSGTAALYVRGADKVFVTLANGTTNALNASGAASSEDNHNLDGTLWSSDDLTINGTGTLEVASAQGHGVVVKDDLALVSGTMSVEAAGHAIQAKDSLSVCGGSYALKAGTDALHCANDEDASLGSIYIGGGSIDATAGSDGLDASGVVQIDDGTLSVSAGDDGIHAELDVVVNGGAVSVTQSYEALEGSTVTVTGGALDLTASDDGINAAGLPDATTVGVATDDAAETAGDGQAQGAGLPAGGDPGMMGDMDANDETASILISGGTLTIDAAGDGIDSNGSLTITGGTTYVSGPTSGGNGALDFGGTGTITGGTLVATGSVGMAQNLGADSTQGSMLVSISGSAGDTIRLIDANGTELASFTPTKAFDCAVISAPGLTSGESYTVTAGSASKSVTMDTMTYSDVSGAAQAAPGGGALESMPGGAPGTDTQGTQGTQPQPMAG